MQRLAPAAVIFAAGLGADDCRFRRDQQVVVGAVAGGGVRLAPAHLEDLEENVGMGLTTGTVDAGDGGLLGYEVRHVRGRWRTLGRVSI
jgi:hypothetical protein